MFEEITDSIGEMTKNKGGLMIIGVVLILLFVVFRRGSKGQEQMTSAPISLREPQYSATDMEGQFANYSSQILSEVNSSLSDFQSDIMDQTSDIGEQTKEYVDDVVGGLYEQVGLDPVTVEKKSSTAWTVGYGTTGAGNPNTGVDLSKDRAKLKEEIERAQSVISYRESKGLQTVDQVAYLNKLSKM